MEEQENHQQKLKNQERKGQKQMLTNPARYSRYQTDGECKAITKTCRAVVDGRIDVQYHFRSLLAASTTATGGKARSKGSRGHSAKQADPKVLCLLPQSTSFSCSYFTRDRAAHQIQLVSDLCDLTIPASSLGLASIDDGILGLAGTLSGVIGVWRQWKATATTQDGLDLRKR